ncbi:MAG: tyrosine-type recombinase/integrase [Planctomycetaceae bacterium]
MPRKRLRIPALVHHKATGQARVRIAGKDHYLGKFGSASANERYRRLVAEWIAREKIPAAERSPLKPEAPLSVSGLILQYLQFVDRYYRKNDQPTSEVGAIRDAMRALREHYGLTPVGEFGPLKLKVVREALIQKGLSRSTINGRVLRMRRLFAWGVENELVPATVYQALRAVTGLRKGRTEAHEPDPIRPVDEASVNAVLRHVSPQVRDLIRLQVLAGCRPGEIITLRPCDLNRNGDVWEYVPQSHKTEHHGQQRRIYFGPKAQMILSPYLDNRPAESACFSPAEAEAERRAEQRRQRKTPVQPSQRHRRKKRPQRRPQDAYDVASYRRAIQRGCEIVFGMPAELQNIDAAVKELKGKARKDRKAELQQQAAAWRKEHVWSPNQLRHTRATDLRRRYGIEAAKSVLGHANLPTTEIYAEQDFEKARAIMAEVG